MEKAAHRVDFAFQREAARTNRSRRFQPVHVVRGRAVYAITTMAAGSFTRRASVSMMRKPWLKSASSR